MSSLTRPVTRLVPGLVLGVVAVLVAALLVAGPVPGATAAGTPTVTGVTPAGQDWANARLKVRWTRISGATYQVRWATSTARLSRAKAYVARTNAATSPTLSTRCVPWYAQVRAVRSGRVGPWSRARSVRFTRGTPAPPTIDVTTQTNPAAAQVRWTGTAYAARYRLDWSAAPYGAWAGFAHNYTPWLAAAARGASVTVPANPAPKDRFLAPAYGNPVFAQLQYDNGCTQTPRRSTYFAAFPKPRDPGDGDLVSIGSYNLENTPHHGSESTKIANIADNIAARNLDVVALQEADAQSAADVIARLENAESQPGWDSFGVGAQQVIWRTSAWQAVAGTGSNLGRPGDGTAATPLPTPGIRLTPAVPEPGRQDVFVASIHLEDGARWDSGATPAERKRDAHLAAGILLDEIASANPDDVPVLAAGDFKGNFGGGSFPVSAGYCDENNGCVGEGQPTFVRAGYWDAQTAVEKVGIAFSTVNKHVAPQPEAATGVAGRPDFILARGAGGFTYYRNVVKTYGDASSAQQSDHNLLFARVMVPRLPDTP